MSIKKTLETLTRGKAPGPAPSFQVFHIIKTLELLANSPVGRGQLAKQLGIGEGATRTLIERLKEGEIVSMSKAGCILTESGRELWKRTSKVFSSKTKLEKTKLTLSSCNVAILVKGKANKIKLGMEQRDAALLAGATGATTLLIRKGKLTMPGENTGLGNKADAEAYGRIMDSLTPREGDAIVIGSADTYDRAEYGALAAAWTLIDDDD